MKRALVSSVTNYILDLEGAIIIMDFMSRIELFVFRHGETDWNKESRFQGHTDIPLNAKGIEQAYSLATVIKTLKPEIILTSDLNRAKHTAQIVNEDLGVSIIETPMLRECRLGEPEGLLRTEIVQKYGNAMWQKWLSVKNEDQDFSFPLGESKREHLLRQLNFIESFLLNNTHFSRIILSTHGGSLRRLVHYCKSSPIEPIAIPNCALYKIEFEPAKREWNYVGPLYLSHENESKTFI